ncbi:MAG: 50S ribosomal protein L23 [Candidatus Nealsonbacteria bacterium]
MALRDLFKKKKPLSEKKEVKETIEEPREIKKKTEKILKRKKKKTDTKLAVTILKAPHITEKATDLTKKNQYTFKVFLDSNKTEIKKAVKQLYGVDVLSVKIIKIPKKRRRLGKTSGWTKAYKKAIVKIKEGQKIGELTP